MKEFKISIHQDIHFGENSINLIGEIINGEKVKKVFFVSDRGLEKVGIVKKVINILEKKGIEYSLFLDVEPNPTHLTVEAGVIKFNDSQADSILAVGGGSTLDASKAIAIIATFGGKITDYEGAHTVPGPIIPFFAIPTTAGTGSEVTPAAVITDKDTDWKFSVYDFKLVPKHVFLDPTLLVGLPPHVAASTGMDALVHAIEAYISLNADSFSDACAEKAMELIGKNIRLFVANRENIEAAGNMILGSMFAGMAFARAKLGNIHAMSHPVSAYFGVAHGVANSILLPIILEFNSLADTGRYEKIYNYIKKNETNELFKPSMLINEIYDLLHEFSIPTKLSDVGVNIEKIDLMCRDSLRSSNVLTNPRNTTYEDIKNLFMKAI